MAAKAISAATAEAATAAATGKTNENVERLDEYRRKAGQRGRSPLATVLAL